MTPSETAILRVLRRSVDPLSGRQVAALVDLAPNTAIKLLKQMVVDGLVQSERKGNANLWTTTADVALLDEVDDSAIEERVVLIVTAVGIERAAVRERLLNREKVRIGGIWVTKGEILGNGIRWTAFLAQAGMGNASSAALVGLAAGELNANLIAFVGSAGGLKPKDHNNGDVIVANVIVNPYIGKQHPGEFVGRAASGYRVPAPLLHLANASIEDSEWDPSPDGAKYDRQHSHVFLAPIVAVESVQTDPESELIGEIAKRFQDAAALDMESFGLAAGADLHDVPLLAVRGISDFLGDKALPGNDNLQETAVSSAAGFLRHMLAFAHPDDFKRMAGAAPQPAPVVPAVPVNDSGEIRLPGGLRTWIDRLRRRDPGRADQAMDTIRQMRDSGVSAATWLSRALHRPPAWLREDDTGDGWALMGGLADLAGSSVSWRAFDRASDAAALTGDRGAQGHLKLIGVLLRLSGLSDADLADPDSDERREAMAALTDFPDDLRETVGPLPDFYRAITERDELPVIKAAAEVAMSWLGFVDEHGVLAAAPVVDPPHELDEDLRAIAGSSLLRQTAMVMLKPGAADDFGLNAGLGVSGGRGNPVLRDLSDDALLLAQWAVRLRPLAEGARLTEAQTLLSVLVSMSGRTRLEMDLEVSKRAKRVESVALEVRDVFSEWAGDSGPAVAAAARARSIQGDIAGALSMLLPAPDGIATLAEASHPEVVRLAAFFAAAEGNRDLAIALADRTQDPIEAAFTRAAVYGSSASTAKETTDALFDALQLAEGRNPQQFQALMALTRHFDQLTDDQRSVIRQRVEDITRLDPELADVLTARIAIATGDPLAALELVRGMAQNELVLTTHADALIDLGEPERAARLLFAEGDTKRDPQILLAALAIGHRHELHAVTREITNVLLGSDYSEGSRLQALGALRHVERMEERWPKVIELTGRLMESLADSGLPVPESEVWNLVEALYFEQRFRRAIEVLKGAPSLSFNQREKVLLFFSVIKRESEEQHFTDRPVEPLEDIDLFRLFMEAAREWAHDEHLAAFALVLSMTSSNLEMTEAQAIEVREYADAHFEKFGGSEGSIIQQISVDENLDELVEMLSRADARNRKLEEIALMVRTNRAPLGVLTAIAGRSYAESLVRVDMGYLIAVDVDGDAGVEAAAGAMNGRVVIDTSALVVGPMTGVAIRTLLGKFDAVVIPEPLRADADRARSSLAMKSTGTIGWDSRRQQPYMTETTDEEASRLALAANDLWSLVLKLRVERTPSVNRDEGWLSAVRVARELGVPLWADDAALRQLARNEGVPAFGSLDLIGAFGSPVEFDAAVSSLRANRVVDLPITQAWSTLAREANWDSNSPFAGAIARSFAWRDVEAAFAQYRDMIRSRDLDLSPESLAAWAHVAGTGLALATPANARLRVVAGLLAWTVFETDEFFSIEHLAHRVTGDSDRPENAGEVAKRILYVAEELRDRHAHGGDAISGLVEILGGVLGQTVGPAAAGAVMADFAEMLGEPHGREVFAAYLREAEA